LLSILSRSACVVSARRDRHPVRAKSCEPLPQPLQEHLRTCDEQRRFMARLHTQEPIRPEEMIFLGLRSLFQFAWPKPTNEDDIRFAAASDYVLDETLTQTALELAKQFTAPEALLPYWGRLAFLRVMVERLLEPEFSTRIFICFCRRKRRRRYCDGRRSAVA
jgi:hypothetical protein